MRSNNLTISIGADSSKLRADLALAQAALSKTKKEFRALAAEAEKTGDRTKLDQFAPSVAAADAAVRKLSGSLKKLNGTTQGAEAGVSTFAKRFSELRDQARQTGTAFRTMTTHIGAVVLGLTGAGAAFVKLSSDAASATDEIGDAAQAIGITTDKLLAMQLAAARQGAETDTLTAGFERFVRVLGEAQQGSESAQKAFQQLGLDANSFAKTNAGRLRAYQAVADRLSRMRDGAQRAAVAADIFGKGWAKQIEILQNLGPNLAAAEKTISEFGLGVTDAEEEQSAAYLKSYNTFLFVFNRMKTILGNILGTAVTPFYDGFTRLIGENSQALKDWATTIAQRAIPVVNDLVALTRGANREQLKTDTARTLVDIFKSLQSVVLTLVAVFGVLRSAIDAALVPINKIFGAEFRADTLLATLAVLKLVGVFGALTAAIKLARTAFIALTILAIRSPFGAMVAGIAALIAYLTSGSDLAKKFTEQLGKLPSGTDKTEDNMKGVAKAAKDTTKAVGETLDLTRRLTAETKKTGDAASGAAKDISDFTKEDAIKGNIPFARLEPQTIEGGHRDNAWHEAMRTVPNIRRHTVYPVGIRMDSGERFYAGQGEGAGEEGGKPNLVDVQEALGEQTKKTTKELINQSNVTAALAINTQIASDAAATQTAAFGAVEEAARKAAEALNTFGGGSDIFQQLQNDASALLDKIASDAVAAEEKIREAQKKITGEPPPELRDWSQVFADWKTAFDEFFAAIGKQAADEAQADREILGAGFAGAATDAQSRWTDLFNWFRSQINEISSLLSSAGSAIRNATTGAGQVGGGLYAAGGYVRGRGTGTSDSIPAWLSTGEFVMRAAAVRAFGPRFMEQLNALRNPFGYAGGGLVSARRVPRFAEGGMVTATASDGTAVHLHIGGGSFALRGDRAIVESLTREARRAGMLSGGRLPGAAFA